MCRANCPNANAFGIAGLVGIYEGGGYQSKGVFRGYPDCRMHTNEAPVFCPVCQAAIKSLIDFNTKELCK